MITIITPSFNSEKFIYQQFQRLQPILSDSLRWLIVDDCSEDNTYNVVNTFQSPFIGYHRLDKNSGPSKARYVGASLAKTEFIFFLDADDVLINANFLSFCTFICSNEMSHINYFFAPSFISQTIPTESDYNLVVEKRIKIIKKPTDFILYGMPNYSSLAMQRAFFISYIKINGLPWGEDIGSYLHMGNYGIGAKWIKPVSCYVITGDGRGSSLSLKKRLQLFKYLLTESISLPKKKNSILYSIYMIFRFLTSYIYKKIRG